MEPLFGNVRQLGHVVADLDSAIDAWSRRAGVGPWLIMRNIPLQMTYRGAASVPLIDLGLAYRGDVQIELIQQKNAAASPYREHIERKVFGLHHVAFLSGRIEQDVARAEAAGMKLVCDIRMNGGRYVYFESIVPGEHGYVELLESTDLIRQMFDQGMSAAASWDGSAKPTVVDYAAMARR